MIQYRTLTIDEINRTLFRVFIRRQIVTKCWRRENNTWIIKDDPFIDDWNEEDYQILTDCLKKTVQENGFVYGAFCNDGLKGFIAVVSGLFGGQNKYLDLASIHVSQDMRGQGIGKALFLAAKDWARAQGAQKLYISAHSAVESQAFYKAMGCVEAAAYHEGHVKEEPYDCQLECKL